MSKINRVEIPSGLMEGRIFNPNNLSIENSDKRMVLDKAVEKAGLNVTERLALNDTFFPNGGGFNLFPENVYMHKFNIFYDGKTPPEADTFTKEIKQLVIPETVCRTQTRIYPSSKGNFATNFDNAIKKLKAVLKAEK